MTKVKRWFNSKKRVALLAVGLLAVGGLAFGAWQYLAKQNQPANTRPNYEVQLVSKGDISVSTTGSGSLIARDSVDLSFSTSGTVSEMNVQAGDKVTKNEVLAKLEDIRTLEQNVADLKITAQKTQKTLDDLVASGGTKLAQALSDRASAYAELQTAKNNLLSKGQPRCDNDTTVNYEIEYYYAQQWVGRWQSYLEDKNTQYGEDYILEHLYPYQNQAKVAYANWKYCEGYTDQEIQSSEAALKVAQAKFDSADAFYKQLKATSAVDPIELGIAEAAAQDAQKQVQEAENVLEGATLVAPMDGVVSQVNASASERVGTGTMISIADLQHPLIQFKIDEADLANVEVGCRAQMVFTAMKEKSFPGRVTQINPVVTKSGWSNTVGGEMTLDTGLALAGRTLPLGLPGTVTITCERAKNVLLVATNAVHSNGGQSFVYLLNNSGEPERRNVILGTNGSGYTEVKEGLQARDRVITSPVK